MELPRPAANVVISGSYSEPYPKLLRMEFATFRAAFIQMPCQIVRGARRLIYRLLSWNPWQGAFFRLAERLHGSRLC
jgi:hypothetical protein